MSIEVMKQALAVLEEIANEVFSPYDNKLGDAILALRAAIEQAQEPRQWQGLTAYEIWQCNTTPPGSEVGYHICMAHQNVLDFAEAIEAKLKEKNG